MTTDTTSTSINTPQTVLEIIDRLEADCARRGCPLGKEQKDALGNELLTSLFRFGRAVRAALGPKPRYFQADVEQLVCSALEHGAISVGRAAEILGTDRIYVRQLVARGDEGDRAERGSGMWASVPTRSGERRSRRGTHRPEWMLALQPGIPGHEGSLDAVVRNTREGRQ